MDDGFWSQSPGTFHYFCENNVVFENVKGHIQHLGTSISTKLSKPFAKLVVNGTFVIYVGRPLAV